ncbi:MAG TPA: dTDP-4-dehydrorhamnose reductase [Thermoleophilaceae bacterium]|nr:dTDP-4-dehydrorhamnose reductase [Thermoleophilaceae bacterium]
MKVLITGAGGMLGQDVRRAAELGNHEVEALDRAALDVTDAGAVSDAFAQLQPDAAINCAAWTDVDGAETAEAEALRLNADAAGNVAAAAASVGASVVQPSTDYVFDGSADRPYVESDPTAPQSAYGRTKLAGEHAVAAANPRHFVVRTAWLFGVGGRNFVETMLRLADSGVVTVVRDQVGSPTYTAHLAEGLLRLAATPAYGVHHMAAGGQCSWYAFARAIFEDAGVECQVLSTTTAEFARPAPRPAYSVLDTEWPDAIRLPDWRDGLREYLGERAATA